MNILNILIFFIAGFFLLLYYKRTISNKYLIVKRFENKFKTLFEGSHSAIIILKNEIIVDCNPKAEKFFGLNKAQLKGKHPADLSPEFQPDNKKSIDKAKQLISSVYMKGETRFKWLHKRNNEVIYADINLSPIIWEGNECLAAFLYDLTENQRTEETLRESENKFASTFRLSPQAMTITTLQDGIFIDVNEIFLSDTGYSRAEILGKSIKELKIFINEDERQQFRTQVIKDGYVYGLEMSFRKKTGTIVSCLISSNIIKINGVEHFVTTILNINDRKQIEEKLKESEVHFRNLADSGQVLIWSAGKNKKSNYFNKTWLDFTGHTLIEEIDGGWAEVIHPDDFSYCYNRVTELSGLQKRFSMDYRLRRYDGEYRWIQDDGSPIYNSYGEFIGYIHHCLDITERKIAEEKLENAYNELKNLYDNIPDALFSVDLVNNKMLQVSAANESVFHRKQEEFYRDAQLWNKLILPEDRPRIDAGCPILKAGKLLSHQFRIKNPSGQIEWIEANIRPTLDSNGKLIRLDGIASNITERKEAEQQIKLLSNVIDQSPMSVIITNQTGTIEYVNNAFIKLTGYKTEEVIGKNPSILKSGIHPEEFYKELWDTILSGNIWNNELQDRKKSGEIFWEKAVIFPILDNNGNISKFVAVKEDITDKKKMIEELIIAKEKAEESNRLKSNFLANMSHELRTPLFGIMGFAELLSQETKDPEHHDMSDTILKSGKRLLNSLNSILDLSRIEANKQEIRLSCVNLAEIIEETVKLFKQAAYEKGLYIIVNLQEQIILESDKELLLKIFDNLISNAIKYTNEGGVRINSSFYSDHLMKYIEINVADTGIGIDAEYHKIVFEPFRQASEGLSRKFEGTGLGLSITKKFVELLNGTISFKSGTGKGSVFTLRFPFVKLDDEMRQIGNNSSVIDKVKLKESENKIFLLLVEDDEMNAGVVCTYLKNFAIIEHVADGINAIKKCRDKKYDAVLMDINLKGINGVEAMEQIRFLNSHYSKIPIIALTAYAMRGDKEKFLSFGFSHYLSKPFIQVELISLLSSLTN
ncbi:MAG: PAS domain S-box protein [Ignavibacteriaceae bacterium]